MHFARSRAARLVFLLGASLAAGSCSQDDIPVTPPPPFLFTDVAISKFVTPAPTTFLHPGVSYTTHFSVNYTLSPDIDAQRNLYGVFAEVDSYDSKGAFLAVLGTSRNPPPLLGAAGGTVSDSIKFTVPATGVSFIYILAGVGLRSDSTFSGFRFGPNWTVQ